jgi:hypothetical protein
MKPALRRLDIRFTVLYLETFFWKPKVSEIATPLNLEEFESIERSFRSKYSYAEYFPVFHPSNLLAKIT